MAFADVEDVQLVGDVGHHPVFGSGHRVAVRANLLMERDG